MHAIICTSFTNMRSLCLQIHVGSTLSHGGQTKKFSRRSKRLFHLAFAFREESLTNCKARSDEDSPEYHNIVMTYFERTYNGLRESLARAQAPGHFPGFTRAKIRTACTALALV